MTVSAADRRDSSGYRSNGRKFWIGLVGIIPLSGFFAAYWEQRPAYNWDMLAYIAVALLDAGVPPENVHAMTYDSLKSIPAAARSALVDDGGYRTDVARDSQRFMDELPFYSVKPVYPWLVSVLYRAGVDLPKATVIVSAVAYAGIPILLFLWFSDLGCGLLSAPFAATMALTPLIPSGRGSGPDTLSELVVLAALYLGFQKQRLGIALAILVLAIAIRPENIIFALGCVSYLALTRRISLAWSIAGCMAACSFFIALTSLSGNYGWQTLMYYNFVNFDIEVRHFVSPLQTKDYALIYLHGLDEMLFVRDNGFETVLTLALGVIGITAVRRAWHDRFFHLIPLAGVCAAARFAILPQHFERAFAIPYLMVVVSFVYSCRETLDSATSVGLERVAPASRSGQPQ